MVAFADVKAILDKVVANWETAHHHGANLGKHLVGNGGAPFGWTTRDELLASAAFGKQLIDPGMIGNGKGNKTNLYLALTKGVPGNPRMPINGPFLAKADTDTIAAWIDAGAP